MRVVRSRLIAGGALLLGGLLTGPLAPLDASANATVCRTDPMVWLSNGHKVDLTVAINTDAANVNTIAYTLHVPAGATVTRVVFTGGKLTNKESLHIYADDKANAYDSDTIVNTARSSSVTATTSVTSPGKESGSDQGQSGQHLPVHIANG